MISSRFEANELTSFSVKLCRVNGSGSKGMGCVGDACSPLIVEAGKARSSIGKTGFPVTRSKTKVKPCLLKTETTSIF